ncbi:MAG: VWA domain-containing protein, partial [Acidobacteria bacterium]|nr:VWA domain-containing protein [Acidobacteriota bacterium]
GLTKDDFEIRENGTVREIATFSNDIQPIALALVLDRSGSLSSRAPEVTAAATGFFDALRPGDRVSLSTLMWDCVPLTDDLPRLRSAVAGPMNIDWGSPIWESIDRAFFAVEHEAGRRAILIFSDGENSGIPPTAIPSDPTQPCQPARTATGATAREVAQRAERNGVLVYAVGVPVGGRREDNELRSLARDTGGDLFRMQDGESLTPAFTRIAEELHSQYLIGFVPTVRDGRSARIEVRAKPRGLQVRARRSFTVPPSGTTASDAAPAAVVLTDADVEAAIKGGFAGRTLKASCTARMSGSGGFVDVTLEGPVARIMRAAKEARDRGEPFTLDNVPPRMRASTVRVAAVGHAPVSTDADAGAGAAPGVFALALRGLGQRPVLLQPVLTSGPRLKPGPYEAEFDLAAVRALGDQVEVIANSFPAARCQLSRSTVEALR